MPSSIHDNRPLSPSFVSKLPIFWHMHTRNGPATRIYTGCLQGQVNMVLRKLNVELVKVWPT